MIEWDGLSDNQEFLFHLVSCEQHDRVGWSGMGEEKGKFVFHSPYKDLKMSLNFSNRWDGTEERWRQIGAIPSILFCKDLKMSLNFSKR